MALSEKAKASLDRVVAKFEAGDLSPIVDVIRIRRHPDDTMPAARWSMANQILAYVQAEGEMDSRGFRQWQDVGRQVKKGGKAIYILAPLTMSKEGNDGTKETFVAGFRYIPVFPLHQTEGDPLPAFDYQPDELPPLFDVAERLGVTVEYGETEGGTQGWYSPSRQHIRLGVKHPATFFHELAHAAHNSIETLKGGQDTGQETVAEFTAAVLSELYGYAYTGNAWRYIEHYAKEPLSAIYKALSTVERVLDVILGAADEPTLVTLPEPVYA